LALDLQAGASEQRMTSPKDKTVGKVKEAVAEILGGGKLREEGKEQQDKAKERPAETNPLGNLGQLT
jgi:uncharacterized protein YjbJ (UPF0337 family)